MDKCYQYIILFLLGIIVYYFLFNNDLVEGFERAPVTSLTSTLKVNVLKRLNEGFRFNKGTASGHSINADGLPVGADIVYHETEDGNRGHYYARGAFMKCHCEIGTKSNVIKGIYISCNSYFAKTYARVIESKPSAAEGVDL